MHSPDFSVSVTGRSFGNFGAPRLLVEAGNGGRALYAHVLAHADKAKPGLYGLHRPCLAVGVHAQRDGSAGAVARRQQIVRRGPLVAAATNCRLVSGQPVAADPDAGGMGRAVNGGGGVTRRATLECAIDVNYRRFSYAWRRQRRGGSAVSAVPNATRLRTSGT
jgi:hypothetical protein